MKIGDYVRTEYGIAKIEEIKPDDKHKTIWYTVDKAQYHCFLVNTQDIIKSSLNIIDLIEEGDYVNGYFIEGNKGNYLETGDIDGEYSYLGHIEYRKIYERDIETIVTKEQFENMEYKVVE